MGIARKQIRWNGWGWAAHQDHLGPREIFWRWLADQLGMPALLATPARALEDITLPAPLLTPDQIAAFAKLLGADRVAQDDYERAFHARGRSYHDLILLRAGDLSSAPDAVLYPRGEEEVQAILELAAREKIPVIPFGGGTSSVGGVTARPGSVSVDLSGMDQLLEADAQAGLATAEAGIAGPALEKALGAKGLTLGHAPQSFEFSTLGGWIAASGVGEDAPRYGRAADWLVAARLVTPQGILDTKDEPDLKHLALGSEGRLGIITRATVRVRPVIAPAGRAFLFRDFAGGMAAIREAMRAEIPCAMLRLSDAEETRFEQSFADMEKPRGLAGRLTNAWKAARHFDANAALLIARFPDVASARRFRSLAKKYGAMALGETPVKDWQEKRFLAPYRTDSLLDRGVGSETLEATANWSGLPALYAAVHAALDRAMRDNAPRPGAHGLVSCHLSQAQPIGASLCFTILFPRQLENEIAQGQAIRRAADEAILAHNGFVRPHQDSGVDVLGDRNGLALAAMRGIKTALDPDGIMNPGKSFPPT